MGWENVTHGMRFGSSQNNLKIFQDGTLRWTGTSTTYEDIQTSLTGRRLASNAGAVDYNWEENTIEFSANGDISNINDCVSWSIQFPHKAKPDSLFRVHVHWEQTDATDREWTLWYRLQDIGGTKVTTWTEVVVSTAAPNSVFVYPGSGTLNQITKLVDVDTTGYGMSTVMQFRLTRSDSVGGGAIGATFVDAHYEIDSTGSWGEFQKYR